MKKREKISLKIKQSVYKFAISYFNLLVSMQVLGGVQSIANYNEVKQYREVIDDFGDFLLDNGVQDPIDVFDYFNYALWEGYLSKDKDYAYSESRMLFFANFGMGNIQGRGVCLNDAGMLKDLYESLGYESEIVLCYVPVGNINIDPNIRTNGLVTRRIESDESLISFANILKPISLFTGNHAITVVKYEGEYYYFDPTNLAYLAKSDINDLDIINGDGSFKKRYLTSFIYEIFGGLKNTFGVTGDDYNLDYLTSREELEINIDKLEEFYQREKEIIDDIADSLNAKPQFIILILAFMISGVLGNKIRVKARDIFEKKYKDNEKELRILLRVFFDVNDIKYFKDVCSYLYYLINNGYLSYEHGDADLSLRKSVVINSPSFVTVDNNEYGEDFFDNFINMYFTKNDIVIGFDEKGNADSFYMHKDENNRYVFYSYSQNLVFRLNDNGELVNGDKKYKLVKLFKGKIMKSEKFKEDIHTDIDKSLCDKFDDKNREKIDSIAKSYAYKR